MPHVAFTCPDPIMWTESGGVITTDIPVNVCLACSLSRVDRGCPWDYSDLTNRIERPIKPSFTPSAMLGCHRERWLKQSVDYAVDPADSHAKVRGTRAHSGFEVDHADVLSEVTVARTLIVDGEPALVVTRPDKVYPKTGLIHDDKTRGYIAQKDKQPVPPEISEDYRYQLSVGAWAWADPENKSTDVTHSTGVSPASTTPVPITKGQITFRDQTKQVRVQVPLIPSKELIPWMETQIRDLRKIYQGGYGTPSSPIDGGPAYLPSNSQWKCKTCPVRNQCGIQLTKVKAIKIGSTPTAQPAVVKPSKARSSSLTNTRTRGPKLKSNPFKSNP